MPPEADDSILLTNRLDSHRVVLDHLIQSLERSGIKEAVDRRMIGLFERYINPLRQHTKRIEELINNGAHEHAWKSLSEMQMQSRRVMEAAQGFLGSLAIRKAAIDKGLADRALLLAKTFADRTGISWLPAVTFVPSAVEDWPESFVVDKDARDELIRMSIPHWDIWHLPFVAHDFGYWVAKQGGIEQFDAFVTEQFELSQSSSEKVRIWHLIADGLATYLMGPAYAHALVFLVLNPTAPLIEGENAGNGRSRYLPSDARRAAMVLNTLQRMNDVTAAQYAEGIYSSELKLLTSVWERSLELSGFLEQYRQLNVDSAPWHTSICEALEINFSSVREQTASHWREARDKVVPVLENGSDAPPEFSLEATLHAAWWCRPRYSHDRISYLSHEVMGLLRGDRVLGILSQQTAVKDESTRLIDSRLHLIESDLESLQSLFSSNTIERADRDAVAGRFYRLLSEYDYQLKRLQSLLPKSPAGATLLEIMRQSDGDHKHALEQETLDFLGGVLMRRENVDGGICVLAEALLHEYSRMTGVNWASRVVLGPNPLFSHASEIVHHSFPDWSIWGLPLMAHEFGHITVPATPTFRTELAEELVNVTQYHPEAAQWKNDEAQAYINRRARHIEEFFADAFAVYCQGPAFAYNVLLLHLNPVEAYIARGFHPTHAERVELILKVLSEMNQQQRSDDYDTGPFDGVIKRFQRWWSKGVERAGLQAGPVEQFHKLKAASLGSKFYRLLNKYYRLGAQYQANEWKQAEQAAERLLEVENNLTQESLRNLLNIAWTCRVRYPRDVVRIEKIIRPNLDLAMARL